MNKRDDMKLAIEQLADMAKQSKDPVAVALYMCTVHMTSVLIVVGEELAEAIRRKGPK